MTSVGGTTEGGPLSLRVAEALTKDVGRGIARLDPRDLGALGAQVGDVIEIAADRGTVARAMPAFSDSRGKSIVQIDGITRQNAGTGIDQKVRVKKVPSGPATKIVLRPLTASGRQQSDARQVLRLLEGLPVVAGDRVRVTLFGSRYRDYEITSLTPRDRCGVVHAGTAVSFEGEAQKAAPPGGVSYEDIGGLRKEIRKVREMIELPLRYPQIFERLGIDAPKGVLLHGPPGTGKTLLARAVAHETDATFITVSGPEVIHKFYGESEAKLRSIFDQAKKSAPAIVFLDELDAIAPKRENVQGEVEKRVVAQLLALMDGLESRGRIIVIGATNLPNHLDPALRRPGRFDREIEIGIPDAGARRETLEIHTRGMPLGPDVDLGRLSAITHGFVGADLEALCREAAMTTLRSVMPELDFGRDDLPDEVLSALQVGMEDFMSALADVEPSAVREVTVEVPDVKWEDVGGLSSVKDELRQAVEWPLRFGALFEKARIRAPKGILLWGPPGTGKTLLARAAASRTGVNFIPIKGPELISKFVGESERAIRDIFRKARQAAPSILFFDEIDAIAGTRTEGGMDSQVSQRVMAQILTEMDGIEELKGVLVMAATNRRDLLDAAVLRPGRFDLHLEVPAPDGVSRSAIFEVHLRGRPLEQGLSIPRLVDLTFGFTGADIEAVCQRASLFAVRDLVSSMGDGAEPAGLCVREGHLLTAIEEQRQRALR